MSDENLNNGSLSSIHQSNNEDKVQSVKNLIQNLKSQLEQEKQLRKDDQLAFLEEKAKAQENDQKYISLQDLLQRQNADIDQLEYKNEALQKKVEELQQQSKEKKKSGGLFDSIFSGKQKQMMEQLQQQLQQCEEELQIKSEETERIHEHLYELKKELNLKIEQLNSSIEQYKSINDQQISLIKKQEQKEVDYKKSIDGLHNAKKIIEKELENAVKDLSNIRVQYTSDTQSLNRVIQIQKELLDIKIPSFKKQSQNYDSLISEDKKLQQPITFKEKEREVFKMFNSQRDCMKKQLSNIFTILQQKLNTLDSNIDSVCNSGSSQVVVASSFSKYKEVSQSFTQKLTGLREGINNIFSCIDKIISLEYQISAAKQSNQTIEQIELLEQQDNQKINLIERLEESKNLIAQFLGELQLYFNEEMRLLNSIPSSLSQINQDLVSSIKDIELIYDYYIQTLQSQIVFNVRDAQHFSYLRDNYKNKQNAREEFIQISTKFFTKICQLFTLLKKKSSLENEIFESLITFQKDQSELLADTDYSSNRPSITFKFQLNSPNALLNENLTFITSLDAFKISILEINEIFFHFFNDFNLKEQFILEQFKSLDLIRIVDEYLNKINKSVDIHCILSNQTQIREMSERIADQNEQISSLHTAVENQNQNITELLDNKSKTDEQLTNKMKIMDEIKEIISKQMNSENECIPSFDNILSLLDHQKGSSTLLRNQWLAEVTQSKARVQDKINQEKFLKEVTTSLAPFEKMLSDEKLCNENDKRALTIFEKSREKMISLIYQLEKRSKDTATRLEEKEAKIKKYQCEINDQKIQIDKIKISSISSSNDNNNNTTSTTTNNLIDLV